ncbi:hypothetical protein BCV69DRAFT_299077 [Microstroma glucosiphilum]|uniref:Uncharacterized protein n=1 Tax=Pseudomicrostroma glucosiphilum TaxID=1684307 RepID=A0A316UC63_9BASI|nr:hypothetical protein BCV69DRAFT_299077 [Pseudomicrostroma glucosiphilum]PWN20595.1 hypothetical protein BCV69DRAFT_299077 [Pseudomicrostroma glucosiphilum]
MAKGDTLKYLVLHSAKVHELLVERDGLQERPAALKVSSDNDYLTTRKLTQLAGTLHLAKRCILDCHASREDELAADELLRRTQATSVEVRLESCIAEVRHRHLQLHCAVHSLQHLPASITHANSPDHELWEQEEKWRRQGQALEQGRQDIIASPAEERKEQIAELMQISNDTLDKLPLPADFERGVSEPATVEAWCDWFRGLLPGQHARQVAAGSRVSKGADYAAARPQRVIAPREAARIVAEGRFRRSLTPFGARVFVASTAQTSGCRRGVSWFLCSKCQATALLKVRTASFLHICKNDEEIINPDHHCFDKRYVESPWQVDWLVRGGWVEDDEWPVGEDEFLEGWEDGSRLHTWTPFSPGVVQILRAEGIGL